MVETVALKIQSFVWWLICGLWRTALRSRPNTELVLADLAEISASSVPLEHIIDLTYVNCLTTSTAWPSISTAESGADAIFSMGTIFVFF